MGLINILAVDHHILEKVWAAIFVKKTFKHFFALLFVIFILSHFFLLLSGRSFDNDLDALSLGLFLLHLLELLLLKELELHPEPLKCLVVSHELTLLTGDRVELHNCDENLLHIVIQDRV